MSETAKYLIYISSLFCLTWCPAAVLLFEFMNTDFCNVRVASALRMCPFQPATPQCWRTQFQSVRRRPAGWHLKWIIGPKQVWLFNNSDMQHETQTLFLKSHYYWSTIYGTKFINRSTSRSPFTLLTYMNTSNHKIKYYLLKCEWGHPVHCSWEFKGKLSFICVIFSMICLRTLMRLIEFNSDKNWGMSSCFWCSPQKLHR